MSKFHDFYNQQREWNGSSNQQNRKCLFNNVRKERRTRTFDLFRGDIGASYEPEALKPIPKITFRDTISKLLRGKKKKAVKKVVRPFVVGTVKHKIHSPPFLHGPLKTRSPKKKVITPLQVKSFAPMNYKFKPPKGLKINFVTPMGEEKTITSPFLLNTVWNKVDNKTTSKKNVMHDNITVRPRDRRTTRLNSSPNSVFSTGAISEEIENAEHINAKKELWPEDEDQEPVFGRLNMYKKERSRETLSKGSEKEDELQEQIKQSVHPNSSFHCAEEESQNPKMENLSHSSYFVSKTSDTVENLNADTFKTPNQSEFKQWIPAKKTTVVDCRVSQISPPKSIFSNTISNFDVSRMHTGLDNPILEVEYSSCSTPLVKTVSEVTPKQVENASAAAVTLHKSLDELVSPHCSLPISSELSKDTNDNKLSSSDRKESLLMGTSICSNTETTTSTTESCNKVLTEEDAVEECSPGYQNTRAESIDSTISPVQESAMNHDDLRIENNSPLISPIEKGTVSVESEENRQKVLNSTYTKYSVLIEEDEEDEEQSPEKLHEGDKKEDDISISSNRSINSSNINEQNPVSENLDEAKLGLISSDDTQKSNNGSTITENDNSSKDGPPLSRRSFRDDCRDQLINAIPENVINLQAPLEKKLDGLMNNSSTTVVSNQTNHNENDNSNSSSPSSSSSSPEVTVKLALKINVQHNNSDDIINNQSQERESVKVSLNLTASNSPIITETQPTEVNRQESEINNSTDISKVSCEKSKCNKLCCYTGANTLPQTEKENGLEVEDHHSFDARESAKTVPNQSLTEIHTPQKVSPAPDVKFKVKVTSPIGLEQTLLRTGKNEDAPAGTVQSRSSPRHVPVINLTDSPIESVKGMTIKSDLRRSTMDCKSPILQSLQKRNPLLSSFDENVVVDLISDDEDDYTSFVHRVLKKYGGTSKSPQQSPRSRTPLASIENISRLNFSTCRTPQSPLVNSPVKKVLISPAKFIPGMNSSQASSQALSANKDVSSLANSPAKTPVSPVPTIPKLHVSPPREQTRTVKYVTPVKITSESPVEKAQVLHDTPRKTPRRRNVAKEIATEAVEMPSPLRVMSLRTRNISVSPSPKKVTPRKTPSRRKATKELATEVSDNADLLQELKLRENDINGCSSPKGIVRQIETSCKTPLRRNLAKEVAEEPSEDTSHLRVMSLRSRNVSVSPSPKKMAPRRRKNDNQRV